MKPSDLTAEQVRNELERIIELYPERRGSFEDGNDYESPTCVYFIDQTGYPVNGSMDAELVEFAEVELRVPVCIVGTWIEEFHPEFKELDEIRETLVKNQGIRYSEAEFDPEVRELLSRAQSQQDDDSKQWQYIDLDVDIYDIH